MVEFPPREVPMAVDVGAGGGGDGGGGGSCGVNDVGSQSIRGEIDNFCGYCLVRILTWVLILIGRRFPLCWSLDGSAENWSVPCVGIRAEGTELISLVPGNLLFLATVTSPLSLVLWYPPTVGMLPVPDWHVLVLVERVPHSLGDVAERQP